MGDNGLSDIMNRRDGGRALTFTFTMVPYGPLEREN